MERGIRPQERNLQEQQEYNIFKVFLNWAELLMS